MSALNIQRAGAHDDVVEQDKVSDRFRPADGIQWLIKLVENFFV